MPARLRTLIESLDPRRSLAAGIAWLVLLLSLGLALVTGFWAGQLTRSSLHEQREARAANAAEQWAIGLDALLAERRQPLRTAAAMSSTALQMGDALRLAAVFNDLRAAYPELQWVGLADANGQMRASTSDDALAQQPANQAWFREGLRAAWIAVDERGVRGSSQPAVLLAAPMRDAAGQAIGVVGARLDWTWLRREADHLRLQSSFMRGGHALLLDARGRVLLGPPAMVGEPTGPRGRELLGHDVSVAPIASDGSLHALGWTAMVAWPSADAARRAEGVRRQIVSVSLVLGGIAAFIGVLLAQRLTRRLTRLSGAVLAVSPAADEAIEVPPGEDEASHLGRAFNALLVSLQAERKALTVLTADLEQRVASRTREVERLADEARYAAVVRERLRIARELHDTLAHSMMAMLAQVRILRKLHARDPAALADELEHAEQTARDGLREARSAITRMRFNGVRDVGLGPALQAVANQFSTRSGIPVDWHADPAAAAFADSRAVTLLRIAEEALRNVEQHARAGRVAVSLVDPPHGGIEMGIADDGIGFDPAAAFPGHYGLVGLREQAQLIEARLVVSSAPGAGTRLTLHLASELAPPR